MSKCNFLADKINCILCAVVTTKRSQFLSFLFLLEGITRWPTDCVVLERNRCFLTQVEIDYCYHNFKVNGQVKPKENVSLSLVRS